MATKVPPLHCALTGTLTCPCCADGQKKFNFPLGRSISPISLVVPGTARRDLTNEHTYTDMTLFVVFTGGISPLQGGNFYTGRECNPPCIAPINEDFTTEFQRRRRKLFTAGLNKTKNPIPRNSASKESSALYPPARISPYFPSEISTEVQSPNALCKDI